jgi:hypothetical protein
VTPSASPALGTRCTELLGFLKYFRRNFFFQKNTFFTQKLLVYAKNMIITLFLRRTPILLLKFVESGLKIVISERSEIGGQDFTTVQK